MRLHCASPSALMFRLLLAGAGRFKLRPHRIEAFPYGQHDQTLRQTLCNTTCYSFQLFKPFSNDAQLRNV